MFKVTKQMLCEKLLMQREKGIQLMTYLGSQWFISKGVLIIFTIVLFLQDDPFLQSAALVGTGYLMGMILAHIRSFIILKKSWSLHKELIDWEKVEQYA
ncbi:MAG: hypothetical protein ABFR90_02955 [Planctomycetota bacterium]